MNEKLPDLNEIKNSQDRVDKINELYELLSSYNAYSLLLLKAKNEYEKKNFKIGYFNPNCYEERIEDLFSSFKINECLKGEQIDINKKDLIFLIGSDTLLRMYHFYSANSAIMGLSYINYGFLKIDKCIGKVYKKNIYEDKELFGMFANDGYLITPTFVSNKQFESYNNKDIREILKPQSFDDIYDKITEAKNIKTKKLESTIY